MPNPSYRPQGEVVIIADDSLFSKYLLGSYSESIRAKVPACLWGAHSIIGEIDMLTNYRHNTQCSEPWWGRPGAVWRLAHPGGVTKACGRNDNSVGCICQAKRRLGACGLGVE